MSFVKFSLGGPKVNNAKAKAEEEAKAREEKLALDKVMAEFEEEHGTAPKVKNVLGEADEDDPKDEDVFVPTGSKRHFTGRQRSMKSGPGTLESESRGFQTMSGYNGYAHTGAGRSDASKTSENVYTTLVAKASNLPPDMEAQEVEALFKGFPNLKITKVEKIPMQTHNLTDRPSASMKVIFDKSATTRDLDAAMMKLNDKKYLSRGYYLHLDRYLGGKSMDTSRIQEPFGARWQAPEVRKGYAPPPDLGGSSREGPREDREQLIVTVNRPPDLATTKLIHQTVDSVIKGGVEFEAALMNIPRIQQEERFAWLYDQKHPLNRYYRWKLHQVVCGSSSNTEIFAGQGQWVGPTDPLPDEFASDLGELNVRDDSDSDGEEERPQHNVLPMGDNYPSRVDNGYGIMSPQSRTMLIWMLTSQPPGSILADDVAAISAFAVEHATSGMDEVVDLLLTNMIQPLQLTDANPRKRDENEEARDNIRRPDLRQITLNAFHIVHDVIFTTSKESGASYKYRGLIGTQLLQRKVFEHLERLPTQLEMGRMTEKSYRDDINFILRVWEDEAFFDKPTLEHFQEVFNAREKQKEQQERERKIAEKRKRKKGGAKGKGKGAGGKAFGGDGANDGMEVDEDDDGSEGEESVGDAGDTGQKLIAEPAPVHAAQVEEPANIPAEPEAEPSKKSPSEPDLVPGETAAARARRLRPKAEDMFASDEE